MSEEIAKRLILNISLTENCDKRPGFEQRGDSTGCTGTELTEKVGGMEVSTEKKVR